MEWFYYNEVKPAINQEVYFIRQYIKGREAKLICEGTHGIMKEDGIHIFVSGKVYSAGPVHPGDIAFWTDWKEFNNDMV